MLDPFAISDVFVSGLGNIERIADCVRFSYYVQDGTDKILVAKLVVPLGALPAMSKWRERFIGELTKECPAAGVLQ